MRIEVWFDADSASDAEKVQQFVEYFIPNAPSTNAHLLLRQDAPGRGWRAIELRHPASLLRCDGAGYAWTLKPRGSSFFRMLWLAPSRPCESRVRGNCLRFPRT